MKKTNKIIIVVAITLFLLLCTTNAGAIQTIKKIDNNPIPIPDTFHGVWGVTVDPIPWGLVDGYTIRQMTIILTPNGQEHILGDTLLLLDGIFDGEIIKFSFVLDVDGVSLSGSAMYQSVLYVLSGTYSFDNGFFVSFWNVENMDDIMFYLFGVI